jgi:hypothetical protein
LIEPNNSPPFCKILISIAFKASANDFASAASLSLFRFSANTFFADEVAKSV